MRAPGQSWITENKRTTCPYCGVGCGVSVQCDTKRSVNALGEVTEHEVTPRDLLGDVSHPANLGKLCVKGSHLLDTNDNTNRLLYPQIGGHRVTWDKALDAMSTQIKHCLSEYGPESIAFYLSGQLLTEDYYIANKLMKGFLGSANVDTNSRLCMSSAVAAYKRAFGADAVPCCYEDLEETELLILVGSNAAWTHPVLFQRMQKALQQHADRKMVVIDPRKTATSAAADLHLALKPGTDSWIFNGLLHFLIANNICDSAYIQKHTNNFDDCSESVAAYTIEAVAKATQLSTNLILQFYKMFASADSALSFYSMGINQSTTGVDKANSIINCHLATGKIGKVGSGPFSITGQPNAMGGREVGGLANMLAAHMDIENKEQNELVQRFWNAPNMVHQNGLKAVDMFAAMATGKIKFVWIMGTNPVVSMPNRLQVEAALKKCDMVVVSDIVQQTDTLAFADIVLPATGWSEKNGTVTNSERRISRQRGFMPLQGECKHDWQIINELAAKLGFKDEFNYQHAYQIFDEHARLSAYENNGVRDFDISGLVGMSKAAFDKFKPVQWPINKLYPKGKKRLFTDGQYYTASGKANFINVLASLPEQLTTPSFPFVLNTGRMRDQWHTMTRTGKAQVLVEHSQQAFIHMHPKDAEISELKNGDLIALTSQFNHNEPVVAPVSLSHDVKQGELFAPIHWSKSNSSHMGLTSLFSSANDPISGQPELKHAVVKFEKIKTTTAITFAIKKSHIEEHIQIAEYQVQINQGDFWLYHLADLDWENTHISSKKSKKKSPDTISKRIGDILGNNIMWLSKSTLASHTHYKQGFQDQELVAYFMQTAHVKLADGLNTEFIRECFKQNSLTLENQHHLFNGSAPAEYQQGRLICSCFKVRKLTIENAILQGVNTVHGLGETLQCGTNCGSCKSELATLIQVNEAQSQRQVHASNRAIKHSVEAVPAVEVSK